MSGRLVSVVAPLYLFACLLLGGSVQGIWGNLALQLAAIAILAWAMMNGRPSIGRDASGLRWVVFATLAVVAFQLIPLPPAIWTTLPGRQPIIEGFRLLGDALPWMPLSLSSERTVSSFLFLLPPGAMLALLLRGSAEKPERLAIATLTAAFISVLVGLMQVIRGEAWYPYRITSQGAPVGLFANSNHLASLLLATIPLLAALAATYLRTGDKRPARDRFPVLAAIAIGAGVVVAGIAINRSFAILLLGGPMMAASALIFLPPGRVRLGRLSLLLALTIAAGALAIATIGGDRLTHLAGQASVTERQQIWKSSAELAIDYLPVGSGLGTFEDVYKLQEDPDQVGREYINHAHNDFLEIVIELGLPGIVLLLAFLAWWASRFIAIWRSPISPPLNRAATLVSLGLMLHSLVDFPLRPVALSALLAAMLGLMAVAGPVPRRDGKGQPRHLRLEDLD